MYLANVFWHVDCLRLRALLWVFVYQIYMYYTSALDYVSTCIYTYMCVVHVHVVQLVSTLLASLLVHLAYLNCMLSVKLGKRNIL